MYRDYHYLNRCVLELNELLQDSRIADIYSQEKNKLYFYLPSEEYPHRHLIISVDPQFQYLLVKNEHHKAKKNTLQFFKEVYGESIQKFEIAVSDRVLKISITNAEILVLIRGGKSNIMLDAGKSQTFYKKSILNDSDLNDISELEFTSSINIPAISGDTENYSDYKSFKAVYPTVSRILFNEINYRSQSDFKKAFTESINEIFNSKIAVTYSDENEKVILIPSSYSGAANAENVYDSFSSALHGYISLYYTLGKRNRIIKELKQHVYKEKERLSNKLNNLKSRIEAGSNEEKYYRYGNLLVGSLHLVKKGAEEIELTDYQNDEEVKIKLDPKLSPQENAEKFFEKAKDEKKNFIKSKELFTLTDEKYSYYSATAEKISDDTDLKELEDLKKELKIGAKRKVDQNISENVNLREYLLDGKYKVWVGKDSKSNDMLSTKIAKQNDYWFHARGLPGSHVVLRVDNPKEGVPKNILNAAASIAAFYSKAKTAKLAPVAYTLRKYVRKKKGMNPGQVIITKEKVLLVKPEMPKNCESITE